MIWRFAHVELDEVSRELRVEGQAVEIEPRPFDLLVLLLERAGEVVSTEEIITATWAGRLVNDASVTNVSNAVSKLRKLIRDENKELIRTVPKVGYRFDAPVERLQRTRASLVPSLEKDGPVPGRANWRLAERLETGGYGDVWLATNTKTGEQRVFKFCADAHRLSALKRESTIFRILRDALGETAPVPALLEWQFEHPPYYVEAERWGLDLLAWCESRGGLQKIPLEMRLHVMILTAEVTATVHSVGVLHKDLKPHNILVRGEGDGFEIRLCDFGAGMMLDARSTEQRPITRIGFTHTVARAGTPTYTAPEVQNGGTPSIQSDVYSLGVLLYQLAVGDWRPMAFGWEADVADELLRDDIARCVDRTPGVRPASASLVAESLRRLPQRREQIERDRETDAHNRALAESMRRTRERRPWVVAAAVMLVVAVAITSGLMVHARQAARKAEDSERVARDVANFLAQDMVQQSSPDYGGRVDVTLKQALLNGIPKIAERLGGNAEVAAELDQSLAVTLNSLGDPGAAARLARQSAQLYAKLYGGTDRRTLSAKVDEFQYRMLLESGEALVGEFDELSGPLAQLPESDPVLLKAATVKAWMILHFGGRMEDSLAPLEQALARYAGQHGDADDARLAYIRLLIQNGRYPAARTEVDRLLPEFGRIYGANGRRTLELHRDLGRIHEAQRADTHDYAAAAAEYRIAIDGLTALYGADSTEVLYLRMDMADLVYNQGNWRESEAAARALVGDVERRLGPDSFYTWRTRLELINSVSHVAELDAGHCPVAVEEAESGLRLASKTLADGANFRRLLLDVAATYRVCGRDTEATHALDRLDEVLVRHPSVGSEKIYFECATSYERGRLALRRRDDEAARRYLRVVVEKGPQIVSASNATVLDARARLLALDGAVAP